MILETTGDLLMHDADIICHQVNYFGVMGGGIALAIKNKTLSETSYDRYVHYCKTHKQNTLGHVLYLMRLESRRRLVANLFSQDDFTTDYWALRECLLSVEEYACQYGKSVALPGNMGCGIAHGEWDKVTEIIQDVFGNSPVKLTIVWWDK